MEKLKAFGRKLKEYYDLAPKSAVAAAAFVLGALIF